MGSLTSSKFTERSITDMEPGTPSPPTGERLWRRHVSSSSTGTNGGGEFFLSANPELALRVLVESGLAAEDLAKLEATWTFFRIPAGFPPDVTLSVAEVAAFDMCRRRLSFAAMEEDEREALKTRCGGSWKLLLRFFQAGEICCRRGRSQVVAGCAHSAAVSRNGTVWTFGNGNAGQLGHGSTATEFRPRRLMSLLGVRIVQVAAGRSRTMLVGAGGEVYRAGRDGFGEQEEAGPLSPRGIPAPTRVEPLKGIWTVQVSMGSFFTAVLSREGRVYTLAWGEKERLGHATDSNDMMPRVLEGPLGSLPVVQIAGGHCYLLALACGENGRSVWSVGCGLGGKLGHGSRSDERLPRKIEHFGTLNFQPMAVAAGAWHAAALSMDGRVATWGWGRHGCLGHGSDQCELFPRVVEGLGGPETTKVCHVAAGDYTTFVVGSGGEVWSFGNGESSCLGQGVGEVGGGDGEGEGDGDGDGDGERPHRRKDVFRPKRMPALEHLPSGDRVVQVSPSNAGHWDAHMLALTENGTVLTCGSGSKGQLGAELLDGSYERHTPELIENFTL